MTTLDERTATAAPLVGTAWLLQRYSADGVLVCFSRDMRTTLRVAGDGAVTAESGLLSGTGRCTADGDTADFDAMELVAPAGACAPGAIEQRVLEALSGSFTLHLQHDALTLSRDGLVLSFVPLAA